ncbi:cytochrome C oxidase subunit IV family protein [Chelativorans sp. AA-79]|uniref:cytochrome C oxidase subunit IV family protein n=1 Tax=Chelativorans sp. AA-79 TaxID=3028735 RepID=UPI0023F784C7|nr:cytochrome C oxidase subunit IV family protein [Chelativorans sp. AA-79]WEX08564.1 cytochrome C oxidase subunit IV family protein [Chelativorans sp. AA-79]
MPFDLARSWGILVVLSLLSLLGSHIAWPALAANAAVLLLGIGKARLILLDFMELRHVPRSWRAVFAWWLGLIAATAWITPLWPILWMH